MKHENVLIRSNEHVDLLNPGLLVAFDDLIVTKRMIPLYYQYLSSPNVSALVDDPSCHIGNVKDVHYDENHNLVGTVIVNDAMVLSQNFTNVIDNFAAIYDGKKVVLKQFIIYDKIAKELIDKKRAELPREGAMPSPSPFRPKLKPNDLKDEMEHDTTKGENPDE